LQHEIQGVDAKANANSYKILTPKDPLEEAQAEQGSIAYSEARNRAEENKEFCCWLLPR
jgi:hypothetical protein